MKEAKMQLSGEEKKKKKSQARALQLSQSSKIAMYSPGQSDVPVPLLLESVAMPLIARGLCVHLEL